MLAVFCWRYLVLAEGQIVTPNPQEKAALANRANESRKYPPMNPSLRK